LILFIPIFWRELVQRKNREKVGLSEDLKLSNSLNKIFLVKSFFGLVSFWFFANIFNYLESSFYYLRVPIDHLSIYVYAISFFGIYLFLRLVNLSLLKYWLISLCLGFLSFFIPILFLVIGYLNDWGTSDWGGIVYLVSSIANSILSTFFLLLLFFTWVYLRKYKLKNN